MARKRNKTSKASKSAQGDMFIEMMEVLTYGDNLENLMAISNPIDPEVMRILNEYEVDFMGIGNDISFLDIIQSENFIFMIPDETFPDILVAEVIMFEQEDFSFLLEK